MFQGLIKIRNEDISLRAPVFIVHGFVLPHIPTFRSLLEEVKFLFFGGFIKYTNSAHKKMAEEKLMDYQRDFKILTACS